MRFDRRRVTAVTGGCLLVLMLTTVGLAPFIAPPIRAGLDPNYNFETSSITASKQYNISAYTIYKGSLAPSGSAVGGTISDYVDNNASNVDSSADKGTHSGFANQQAGPDNTNDTLTEENTGGSGVDTEDYVDNNSSDVDSSADKGTQSNFTAQQYGPDSIYDNLTETGSAALTPLAQYHLSDATDSYGNHDGINHGATFVSGILNNAAEFGGSSDYIDISHTDFLVNDAITVEAWIKLDSVTGTQGICTSGENTAQPKWLFQVNGARLRLYVPNAYYSSNTDLSTGIWYHVAFAGTRTGGGKFYLNGSADGNVASWSTGTGGTTCSIGRSGASYYLDGLIDELAIYHSELSQANITYRYNSGIGREDMDGTYDFDSEVQWTAADYDELNEELCIYAGAQDAEALKVDVWTGAAWATLIADLTASSWNNVSVSTYLTSATFTIRFKGGTDAPDGTIDSWLVDSVLLHVWGIPINYELDLEEQWTSANYTHTNEELCIFAGPQDAEALKVDVWNGASWSNVISDLTWNQWNNVSVASYLSSATFTIRFKGATESSDTTQNTWEIDATLLHTWTTAASALRGIQFLNASDGNNATFYEADYVLGADTADHLFQAENSASAWGYDGQVSALVATTEQAYAGSYSIKATVSTSSGGAIVTYDNNTGNSLAESLADMVEIKTAIRPTSGSIKLDYIDIHNTATRYFRLDVDQTLTADTWVVYSYYISNATSYGGMTVTHDANWIEWGFNPTVACDVYIDSGGLYGKTAAETEYRLRVEFDFASMAAYQHYDLNISARANDSEYMVFFCEEGSGTVFRVAADSGAFTTDTVSLDASTIQSSGTAKVHLNDTLHTTDTVNTSIDIDLLCITAWNETNDYPDITDALVVTNVDDTDMLYSRARSYLFKMNVSDADGYSDLHTITLRFMQYAGSTNSIWSVRYNNTADAFSEVDNPTLIELVAGSCVATRGGNFVNLTFAVKLEWVHTPYTNIEPKVEILDNAGIYENATYAQGWDSENRLEYAALAMSDTRGDPSQTNTLSGKVRYLASSSNVTAPTNEIDLWALNDRSLSNVTTATHNSDGTFTMLNMPSYASVGMTTYTVNTVVEGDGVGGSDLAVGTQTTTYISDRVIVTGITADYTTPQITQNVYVSATLQYQYDSTEVIDGTVTINAIGATHNAAGVWRIQVVYNVETIVTYENVTYSGGAYGLNNINNTYSLVVTWSGEGPGGERPPPIEPPEDWVIMVFGSHYAALMVIVFGVTGVIAVYIFWWLRKQGKV